MQDDQANFNDAQNEQEQNGGQTGHTLDYAAANELLPSFVLGALEPEEMLAVERYVHQHQALLDRLTSLEATMAQLAYAAPMAPLPSQTKTSLLQRAQADMALQQVAPPRTNPLLFPPPRRSAPRPSASVNPAVPPRPRPTYWFGMVARTLIGASIAAALLLLALSTLQLRSTASQLATQLKATQTQLAQVQQQNSQVTAANQALQQQVAQLAAIKTQVSQLQEVNRSLQQQLQNGYTQITVVINAQREIALASTAPNATAKGAFYIHNNTGVLFAQDLQPLPGNQTYEFWLIPAQGAPVAAGLMPMTSAGPGILTVTIPPQNANFAAVGLSIEPAAGSTTPTGPIVLLSSTT